MEGQLIEFSKQLGATPFSIPKALREEAEQGISKQKDFPTTRDESWKYTRLGRVSNLTLKALHFSTLPIPTDELDTIDLIFDHTGWYCSSLPTGITISSSQAINPEGWLACTAKGHVQHLNLLSAQGGICLSIKENSSISKPIRIIHRVAVPHSALVLHHQISLGANAKAQVELIFEGHAEDSYSNVLVDFFISTGSRLHVDKIQHIKGAHFSFCTERVFQDKDSTFALQTISLFPHFSRNDVEVFSQGEGTHTQLHGAFVGNENNHIDNHTYMHHTAANCTSDENYKGVLSGKATGVFNGKVKVYKDAQKINAYQSNKNILLSEAASINAKPELEIYADDVKCSHGSTTGQLDQKALFFLRARGISETKARDMLVKGFLSEIIASVESTYIQNALHSVLD